MNVSLTDPKDITASGPGGPRTFWKRVAQIFDQLVLNRSRDAVPDCCYVARSMTMIAAVV